MDSELIPNVVGQNGDLAVATILNHFQLLGLGDVQVYKCNDSDCFTCDFIENRIRVYCNENGNVSSQPIFG